MRLIQLTAEGRLELNWMWLPTWLGMNGAVLDKVEKSLAPKIRGVEVTEQTLDDFNTVVLDELVTQFPELGGLRDYLDGLKFVGYGGGDDRGDRAGTGQG